MEETPTNPPPAGPTAVVGPQSCTPYVVDLMVKKVFNVTEGNFSITDVNDNVVFKVKGPRLGQCWWIPDPLHAAKVTTPLGFALGVISDHEGIELVKEFGSGGSEQLESKA